MTPTEIIKAVAIHVGVPLAGVALFVILCSRMKRAGISAPPFATWFILFFTLGGWLLLGLTVLFWQWSGMASLGVLFLISIAPVLTAASAWSIRRNRAVSSFHRFAFLGSVGYTGLMVALVFAWVGFLVGRPHS